DETSAKPMVTQVMLVEASKTSKTSDASASAKATLTRENLRQFLKFIEENTYTTSAYRNVKTNAAWVALYKVGNIQFAAYNQKTDPTFLKTLPGSYCQRSNVVLPLANLTIDHQKAQQGGGEEAMLRVFFRAAGLTLVTGSDQKNRAIQALIAPLVGGNQTVLALGQRQMDDNDERYTSIFLE